MDFDKYQQMISFLSTGKYPTDLKDHQKRQLKKIGESFVIKHGELYHIRDGRFLDSSEKQIAESQKVVVGGSGETERIIRQFHMATGGTHLSVSATREKVAEKYWWPGLATEVADFLKKCEACRVNIGTNPANVARAETMRVRRAVMMNRTTPGFSNSPTRKRQRPSNPVAATPSTSSYANTTNNNTNDLGLKKSVLLLQQQVFQSQLEYQQEKKETMSKFGLALDEFRRHLAEQRMVARGVNVSNVPVDIPPGMEGFGI